jgi:hypothetical protein
MRSKFPKVAVNLFGAASLVFGLSACQDAPKPDAQTANAQAGSLSTVLPITKVAPVTPLPGFKAGTKPPEYYAEQSKNPVVSQLSFDEIAARVASFVSRSGADTAAAPIKAYVFFDPLCKHCAKLVQNLMTPQGVKIIGNIAWVPVGFLQEFSTLQGAAILSSSNPGATFIKHEAFVASGNGSEFALNVKIATQANIDKVIANTGVWKDTGATQVPFTVTKTPAGKTLAVYGALQDFMLAEFIGQP